MKAAGGRHRRPSPILARELFPSVFVAFRVAEREAPQRPLIVRMRSHVRSFKAVSLVLRQYEKTVGPAPVRGLGQRRQKDQDLEEVVARILGLNEPDVPRGEALYVHPK